MWLLNMAEIDGVKIIHCRNGREYRLPELPGANLDVYCHDTCKSTILCLLLSRTYVPAVP